ncbi:MAG: LD-carboxypeptidase [Flammeovirgaceae bacterium]|nr:LD-carboxypeptidase [Flammeovirgaceae bacterium]
MIRPFILKTGDSIILVAPSRKINRGELERAISTLQQWSLHVELGKNIYSQAHSYFAGTDEQRLHDFQNALDDPTIKAIFCARGGYGFTRILDQLDFTAFQKNPKWIIGFSDITALHLKLLSLNIESIHGIMPLLFSKSDAGDSIESLRTLLMEGITYEYTITPHRKNRTGKSEGKLVGGNLSLVVDSLGTVSELNLTNCILVIEEVDEYLYRIDRMLLQLKRSGKLSQLSGLVIGHMSDLKDTSLPFGETIEEIILDKVRDYDFPVAFNFQSGHEHPNLAWRHGAEAILDVTEQSARLKYKSNLK